MNVDPDNRLVADSLEAEWNQALRALADAKDHCEKQSEADRAGLSDAQCAAIAALAGTSLDFGTIASSGALLWWHDTYHHASPTQISMDVEADIRYCR